MGYSCWQPISTWLSIESTHQLCCATSESRWNYCWWWRWEYTCMGFNCKCMFIWIGKEYGVCHVFVFMCRVMCRRFPCHPCCLYWSHVTCLCHICFVSCWCCMYDLSCIMYDVDASIRFLMVKQPSVPSLLHQMPLLFLQLLIVVQFLHGNWVKAILKHYKKLKHIIHMH